MKKMLGALLVLTLAATVSWPQAPRGRIVTHPKPPNREMLRRMDMDLRWHLNLPRFDYLKDGLFSVQIIPGDVNPQLIVQTYLGEVILLDAENGDIIWRNRLDMVPPDGMFPCAYNSHSIYVVRNNLLYILDRESGIRLLYLYDKDTKERTYYGFPLFDQTPAGTKPTAATPPLVKPYATPVADEDMFFYSGGDRIVALFMPNYKRFGDPFPLTKNAVKPALGWIYFSPKVGVKHSPIVTTNQVGIVKVDGTFQSLGKEDKYVRFTYKTVGRVGAAMGVHSIYTNKKKEAFAYICSYDQTLYAIDLFENREAWRYLSPGPIQRKPYVSDRDVFIKVDKGGFIRVDRAEGKEMWSNKQALQFMASNRLFVYTRDTAGALLIHDYIRGSTLAEWDFRDWSVSVPNELTDRVYLANDDGQILCLANHDYPRPQFMKNAPFEIPRPVKAKVK